MNTSRRSPLPPDVLLAALVVSLATALGGTPIQLQPAVTLMAGAAALDVGEHAIPCVTDWNGDGLPDLLLGHRPADKIAVFLNVGTALDPAFQSSTNLQAAGAEIQWPSAACGAPAPWVCDYDQDGRRDLLVGTGLDGHVWFYPNEGSDTQPVLDSGIQLTVGAAPLAVPARATPYVYDWDEDGLKDLLCGAGDGQVYFFRNTGTSQSPAYAPGVVLLAGGLPLDLGDRSVVRVLDWDGDGLKDLIGSASYKVSWCRNTGRNSSPVLERPVAVQAPVQGAGLVAVNTGYRMRLELADLNADDVLDLLVGNHDGKVLFYRGYRFAIASPELVPPSQLVFRWNSAPYLNYQVLAGPSPGTINLPAVIQLVSQGTSTRWTNAPGGDARFYRVQVVP